MAFLLKKAAEKIQTLQSLAKLSSSSTSTPQTSASTVPQSSRSHSPSEDESHYSESPPPEFASDGENESKSDYRKGGYHPVKIGDVYHQRYVIEKKLGWGHFSTVWLASDKSRSDDDPMKLVALKIQKSAQHYFEAGEDEVQLLTCVRDNDPNDEHHVVRFIEHFVIHGPNGKHLCMVFEVLGESLLTWIQRYHHRGLPLPLVQSIAHQLLTGLAFLHDQCKIIHTDLKPENVILLRQNSLDPSLIRRERELEITRQRLATMELNAISSSSSSSAGGSTLTKSQKKKLKQKQKKQAAKAASAIDKAASEAKDDKVSADAGADASADAGAGAGADDETPSQVTELSKMSHNVEATIFDTSATSSSSTKPTHPPKSALKRGACNRMLFYPEDSNRKFVCKLADLGNACWVDHHFTDDITTRQYRAPETLLGQPYDCSVDIFSAACLIFEMLTGDFLFDPREGKDYSRDEDHLASMIELLGDIPKELTTFGKFVPKLFNKKNQLIHIHKFDYWDLKSVLIEKYRFHTDDATVLSNFLTPMLAWKPSERIRASEALKHSFFEASFAEVAEPAVVASNSAVKQEADIST